MPPDPRDDALVHESRPGVLRRTQVWRLGGDALHWRAGARTGQVPLSAIAALRLELSPEGAQRPSTCVIVETSGRRHRITDLHRPSRGRLERRTASFVPLATALVRRLAQAYPQVQLMAGPGRGEWIASLIVGALAVAMLVGGAGLMIYHATIAWAALAYLGVLVFTLPLLWPVIRTGGPAPLDPATLPETD